MRHQSMYTVNLGRGSKAFPASMQLPKWEIVTSAKCVRQPYLFSNMSQATLPSFCESECFSTTHSVSYLELHYSCVITTSCWGHRPKWEELKFKPCSSNEIGTVDSISHDIWLASVLLLQSHGPSTHGTEHVLGFLPLPSPRITVTTTGSQLWTKHCSISFTYILFNFPPNSNYSHLTYVENKA